MFLIGESVTTVNESIFINNSAALDGGVFYTCIHASDNNIIRRSKFNDNAAGDYGGTVAEKGHSLFHLVLRKDSCKEMKHSGSKPFCANQFRCILG